MRFQWGGIESHVVGNWGTACRREMNPTPGVQQSSPHSVLLVIPASLCGSFKFSNILHQDLINRKRTRLTS